MFHLIKVQNDSTTMDTSNACKTKKSIKYWT